MKPMLQVGVESNCTAPLRLEQLNLRLLHLAGVDSLFLPDHFQSFIPPQFWSAEYTPAARLVPSPDAYFQPFVMLGMMATRYRRVRLGTGVTEAFRHHPVTLAQAFVTLDHLSRGRAILGIGNGERENTEPYGLPFRRRVARLEEALEILRRLWASGGEPVDFDGETWRLRKAVFATPLYGGRPPRLWVAAHAPRMLRLTGRYGDGWYPTLKLSPAEYRIRLGQIAAAAAEAGRPFDGFEPAAQLPLILGKDRRSILDRLVRTPLAAVMALLLPGAVWKRHGLEHPLGEQFEGFPDFVPREITPAQAEAARRQATPELIAEGIVTGNLEEVLEEIRGLVEAGARHVVFWNLGPLLHGASPVDIVRLAVLVRRLHRIPLRTDAGLP
jgi:phthiodiolone/phenolphthiodiolone dimycocerosates ketoreductase